MPQCCILGGCGGGQKRQGAEGRVDLRLGGTTEDEEPGPGSVERPSQLINAALQGERAEPSPSKHVFSTGGRIYVALGQSRGSTQKLPSVWFTTTPWPLKMNRFALTMNYSIC